MATNRVATRMVAATAGIAALMVASWLVFDQPSASIDFVRHTTKFGQMSALQLADGSEIELNTDTGIRVTQFDHKRNVWLDRGEAFFDIAKDEQRPFIVHAGLGDVTVLGTKFAVRREGGKLTISVIEGRVRVSSRKQDGRSTTITAGDILTTDGQTANISTNELDQITQNLAWRQGMISFQNASLADVATQFNRYNERKLIVGGVTDAKRDGLRITGSFRMSNVDGFSRLIEHAYGLRVLRSEKEIRIIAR